MPSALGDEGPKADLIAQEVAELKKLINASKERLTLLAELKDALQTEDHALPDAHARVLREKMPLLSEVMAQGDQMPSAAADDYLITKAVVPSSEEVSFVKFLPTRSKSAASTSSPSSTQSSMPTALLVAAQADGALQLFAPTGDLVLSFSAGHDQPVTNLAVTTFGEDNLIATADAGGIIRVHRVGLRQRRQAKPPRKKQQQEEEPDDVDDDRSSQYLDRSLNVTAQLHRQMQLPEGSNGALRITALAFGGQGGSKYVLAGDEEGKVSVFMRNGTLRSKIDTKPIGTVADSVGVDSLSTQAASVLFHTGGEWGFLDVERSLVKRLDCPRHEGSYTTVVLDSQLATRVLAADGNGTIWVYNTQKKECILEARYKQGVPRGFADLASVWGFAIGLEKAGVAGESISAVALNMSQLKGRGANKLPEFIPSEQADVVWRRERPPVRAWTVLRRVKEGDLLAFLSEDGHEIEIVELLMQVYSAPAAVDSFGNFQMPVIAVAVLLVLGYQYLKQKNKASSSPAGMGKDVPQFNAEDLLKSRKKFEGLKK